MKSNLNQINTNKDDLYYRIMLIGGKFVGKSQILRRFCREEFDNNYNPTFGMDFRLQKYFFENLTTTLQIIEVSGKQIPPQELLKDYILEVDCFICIYDISKKDSINELNNIISDYEKIIGNDKNRQCWYFVGNKCDLLYRECSNNPAEIFGYTPFGTIGFIEVSAKENKFIENLFNNAIFQIKNIKRRREIENQNYNNKLPTIRFRSENKQMNIIKENKEKCIIL